MAIVHDWLDTWAGSEQALSALLDVFPDAQLFALVDYLSPELRARIGGRHARTSFLQRMPAARRHFRRYLPLFPKAVECLDVSAYDLVISSSHAVAKGAMTRRGAQLHVCYCYSPVRYAWDLRDQYLAQVGLDRGPAGWLAHRMLDGLQRWDRAASERVDHFVAISHHIADRIARAYGRDASVIYPPVDLPAAGAAPGARDVYVTVSRLVPYKRIDLIAAAFRALPERELVVIGEGPERARIEAAAGPNVRLLGQLDDVARDAWLRRARAFVFAAEEDFGIAPLEAQAHGAPVVAYAAGGVPETVRGLDDAEPTGVFFAEQSPQAIATAIRTFEANAGRIREDACRRNAERFAPRRFHDEFAAYVAARWDEFRSQECGR